MEPERSGYSRDGYIVDQGRLMDVPYGCRTSDYNGCGWIAVYNFLRSMGHPVAEQEIREALSRHALFRGLLGTSPVKIRRYLKKHGYPLRVTIGRKRAAKAAEGAAAGIVLYRHSNGWHFVAFAQSKKDGGLHFFNAHPGSERHIEPMDAFLGKDNLTPAVGLLWLPKEPDTANA